MFCSKYKKRISELEKQLDEERFASELGLRELKRKAEKYYKELKKYKGTNVDILPAEWKDCDEKTLKKVRVILREITEPAVRAGDRCSLELMEKTITDVILFQMSLIEFPPTERGVSAPCLKLTMTNGERLKGMSDFELFQYLLERFRGRGYYSRDRNIIELLGGQIFWALKPHEKILTKPNDQQ